MLFQLRPAILQSQRAPVIVHWRRYLSVALILAYLLVLVAAAANTSGTSPIGLSAAWDNTLGEWVVSSVSPISIGQDANIRLGDVIVAVDGQTLAPQAADVPEAVRTASQIVIRDPATGTERSIDVMSRAPNLAVFTLASIIAVAVGFIALIWGHGPAPRALALTCYVGGVELIVAVVGYWQVTWAAALNSFLLPLAISGITYLSLVFPVLRHPRFGRWQFPTLLVPFSALPVGVTYVLAVLAFSSVYSVAQPVIYLYYLACLIGAVTSFGYSWWHSRHGREGTQLRIVTFGSILAILPFLLLSMLPRVVLGYDFARPELSILAIVLMPASFGYAILRYQIMDLHVYIRRGLVYSTFALITASLYALVLFATTLLVKDRSGSRSILAVAIMSALIALAGERVRDAIQRFVDRLFDRRRYDYRRQLLEFSRRMSGILDPGELAHSAVELIAQTMGSSFVRLYLHEASTHAYHLWSATGLPASADQQTLGLHHPNVEEVREAGDVVQRLDVPPEEDAVVVPLTNKGQPVALLTLGPKIVDLPYSSEDLSLLRTVANHLAVATENAQLYARMRDLYLSGVRTLAATVDAKDSYTHGHSERVSSYARAIATELGLPRIEIEQIELAGWLHDIGKIGIPDRVLQKPGRLDPDERAMIMEHAALGAKILADNLALMPLVPFVRHHHEWYDGDGYPDGLSGDEIPLGAAIISVADTYDTMTTDRPYRRAPGREKARAEIERCAGTQFNPTVVAAFLRALDREPVPVTPDEAITAPPGHDPIAGRISAVDARAMHVVYKVAQMIGEVTELGSFMNRVIDLIRREIGVGRIDIYLVDDTTGDLIGQTHAPGAVTGARIPAGQGVVGWVATYQMPARVNDTLDDSRALTLPGRDARAELAVPLVIDGRTIGVISLESRRTGVFTEDDEELLTIVAQQLAQVVEVAQLHDRLKRSAMMDGLTGVANHRRFYERLEDEVLRTARIGEPLSLMLIDVDGLKALNDTQGHLAGDAALRELAGILLRESRANDLVARLGGDEFAIILPGLAAADAGGFAQRLAKSLSEATVEVRGQSLPLPSISWGLASSDEDGHRTVTLVALADERMYKHKGSRRLSRYQYTLYPG